MLVAVFGCAVGHVHMAGADNDPAPVLVDAPREVRLSADGAAVTVALRTRDATRIRLQLERAPLGVRLEPGPDEGWTLHWDHPDERFEATVVLGAALRKDPSVRQRIEIRFLPASAAPAAAVLSLPPVLRQVLRTGKPWELWLHPRVMAADERDASSADEPIVVVDSAPAALTIGPGGGGWYRLALTPERPGEVEFEVIAQHADGREGEASQPIRLTVLDAAGAPVPGSVGVAIDLDGFGDLEDPDPPDAPNAPDVTGTTAPPATVLPAVRLRVPGFAPLANQIVSAGRAVVFKVAPVLPDGQRAVVQIDRLPRTARFDEADDGSRTFHWLTGESDQGEHLFRLTAVNVEDAALRSTTEIVVIVGDPTRSRSSPAQ